MRIVRRLTALSLAMALAIAACGIVSATQASSAPTSQPVAVGVVKYVPALDENIMGLAARFILIPPGTFLMGSPLSEQGRQEEGAQHQVTLTHRILVQATPVTQGQFNDIMGFNPSYFTGNGRENHPVERVTWYDAVELANRLSLAAGLKPAYVIKVKQRGVDRNIEDAEVTVNGSNIYETAGYKEGKAGFRLPTEAEREYFTRAGSVSPYSFGSDINQLSEYAWYRKNSGHQTHQVGKKKPNAWGLYDMYGNVAEWTQDRSDAYPSEYPKEAVIDPTGPAAGSSRIIRGGTWRDKDVTDMRSACRGVTDPGFDYGGILGFRLVRSIP